MSRQVVVEIKICLVVTLTCPKKGCSVTLHLFTKFPSSGFRSKILSGISVFPGICCDLPPSISEKSPILQDLEDEGSLLGGPLDQPEHTLLIKIRAVPMLEGDSLESMERKVCRSLLMEAFQFAWFEARKSGTT